MVRADVQREPWKRRPSPELTESPGEGCVCLSLSRGPQAVRCCDGSRTQGEPGKEKRAENLYNQWMCFFG